MFRNLPRYDHYAPNDSPWLGELPSHWLTQRTKSLLVERSQKGYPDEPLLAATQSHGVILKSDYGTRTVTATKDLHLLKLVEVGDFVISLRSFQGGIERCHHRGIISPAYTVLTAKSAGYREYLTYLFKSRPFVDSLTLSVTGIREGQNIDYATLAVDRLPVPTSEEQVAIVKYLAHANARIDKAIAAKRRLIALLDESFQAFCDIAVRETAGAKVPLKSVVRLREGPGIMAADFREAGVPLIRIAGMHGPVVGVEGCNFLDPEMVNSRWSRFRLECGDFLLSASGSTGEIKEVGSNAVGAIPYTGLIRLRPVSSVIDMEFLALFVRSAEFVEQISLMKAGVGIEHFGPTHLKRMWIRLPDSTAQGEAVARVREEGDRVSAIRNMAEREIALLQEFRTRLVADVVMGQVDVRAIAGGLPDVVEASDDLYDFGEELSEVVEGADA